MARRKRKRKTHMPPKKKRSRIKSLLFAVAIIFCLIFAVSCRVPVDESGYDNLMLGIPGPADTVIDRPGYALGYDELHEQPAWVIYRLTSEEQNDYSATLSVTYDRTYFAWRDRSRRHRRPCTLGKEAMCYHVTHLTISNDISLSGA